MELQQTLQEAGFEEREVRVYLALLELDESTVLPIAKKAGIKRTYTYDILDSLMKRGLVAYIEKNGRRRYTAEDPKKIEVQLRERLQQFRDILPEIQSIYNRKVGKPRVRFYEGATAVSELYDELGRVKEYASLASPDHFFELLGKEYIDQLTNRITKKKIHVRELFARSYTEVHFEQQYDKKLQEVRWLPEGVDIDTDMLLFENKLVLISYRGTVHAISIESSSIIATHTIMFDLLWQTAKQL